MVRFIVSLLMNLDSRVWNRCEAYGAYFGGASDKERQSPALRKCRTLALPGEPGQALLRASCDTLIGLGGRIGSLHLSWGEGWLYNLRAWTTNRSPAFSVKPRNSSKSTAPSSADTAATKRPPN